MKKIETKRLYLRQFNISDITLIYIKALQNEEIIGLTEARHTKWSEKKVKDYIKNSNKEGESILVGIFIKELDKPIGNIRVFNFHSIHKRAELGIMLYDKSEWGKGYGTEALKAIVQFAFNDLKLHRICADYYSINKASARIFEKVGFNVEGVFKDHFFIKDKFVDSIRVAKINN